MTKKNDKQNKIEQKENERGFSKETFFIAIIAFSILLFVMLCARKAFGGIGDAADSFLLGTLGYAVYPTLIAATLASAFALFNKKVPLKTSSKVFLALASFLIFSEVHLITTRSLLDGGFSSYLSACFHAADSVEGTVGSATAFGVLGALVSYGSYALLSFTGAIVVLSLFSAGFLFLFARSFVKRGEKRAKVVSLPEEDDQIVRTDARGMGEPSIEGNEPPLIEPQKSVARAQTTPTPPQDYSQNDYPQNGYARNGYPQNGYPQNNGYVQGGYSQGGYRQNDYAPNNYPQNGYAPQRNGTINPYAETARTGRNTPSSDFSEAELRERALSKKTLYPDERRTISSRSEAYPKSAEEEEDVKNILLDNSAEHYRSNLIYDENSRYNSLLKTRKPTPRPTISENRETYQENYQRGKDLLLEEKTISPAKEISSREEEVPKDTSFERERMRKESELLTEDSSSYRRLDRFERETDEDLLYSRENSFPSREDVSNEPLRARDAFEEERGQADEAEPLNRRGDERFSARDTFAERDNFSAREDFPAREDYSEREENDYSSDRFERRREGVFDEETGRRDASFGLTEAEKDDFFHEDSNEEYLDEEQLEKEEPSVPSRRGGEVTPVYEEEIRQNKSAAKGMGMFGKTDFTVHKEYVRPPISLFKTYRESTQDNLVEQEEHKRIILDTLQALVKIQAEVVSVTAGPTFTRYDVKVPSHVPSKKITACATDIAMNLHAKDGVNIFPNLENGTNSIEVPNKVRSTVGLAPLLSGSEFKNDVGNSLMFAIGKDVEGRNIYGRISKMTHLLVAGATGAGKSIFLNSLILSLIMRYTPEELRLILVDPKQVEFTVYSHMPHLMVNEIVSDPVKVIAYLNWAVEEMQRRYMLFKQMSVAGSLVRNIDEYNEHASKKDRLPKIVIVVDELADLMAQNKNEIEDKVSRLAALARACGIHLVLATQRPSVNVITGVIKANLPTRFAFKVSAEVDSRTILDEQGAEKLLGSGDLLYKTSSMFTPMRVQGAFVSSEEVQAVVNYIKENNEAYYDSTVEEIVNRKMNENKDPEGEEGGSAAVEPIYIDALRMVVAQGSASISMIQRKFSVGYNKAGRIIEWMQEMGYVSDFEGSKTRRVLLSQEEFDRLYGGE